MNWGLSKKREWGLFKTLSGICSHGQGRGPQALVDLWPVLGSPESPEIDKLFFSYGLEEPLREKNCLQHKEQCGTWNGHSLSCCLWS